MSKTIVVPGGSILKLRSGKWAAQRWDGTAVHRAFNSREEAVIFLQNPGANMTTVKVSTKAKTAAKASKTPAKREAAKGNVDKQRAEVAKLVKKGTTMGDIAEQLHVTAGRAKYLHMLNEVEAGNVPSISTAGNDEAIAKRIVAARSKQDEFSSWGWISARSGIPEARVKTLAESGGAKVKGTHVAKERAAGKPAKAKAATKVKAKANPSK